MTGTSAKHRRWLLAAVLLAGATTAFAVVLPLTATVARDNALESLAERSRGGLRLYIANVRRELEKYEYLPALLADDTRLAGLLTRPHTPGLLQEVNEYLALTAQISGASDIYLMDATGRTLAASNWSQPDSFIGDDYSFRPYFQQAIQGRLGRYFALGYRSGERGYYFAYPLMQNGRTLGVVAVKVSVAVLEQERGDENREFLVTDPRGIVFLSTEPEWRFHTLEPLTAAERAQVRASRRYGDHALDPMAVTSREPLPGADELIDIAGRKHAWLRAGMPMAAAGWTVHMLANTAGVQQQVTRAVLLSGSVLGTLMLAALIFWQRRLRLNERMRFEHEAGVAAAANEARVQAIIDNTRAGLLTLNGDGYITSCNPTASALFEHRSEALRGQPFTALIDRRDRAEFVDRLATAATSHDGIPASELTGLRSTGAEFPVEVAIKRMNVSEGPHFLVTLHDLSTRKESERALRRAHDELEQRVAERTADLVAINRRLSEEIEDHRRTGTELRETRDELIQAAKLAAIGELSAGINHELNQPLTALRAFADNARAYIERGRDDEARENLEQIGHLIARMGRIIRQLQLFARKSPGTPVPVALDGVIDAALALLATRLNTEGVCVTRALSAGDVLCLGDMVRLEQVFVNLIGNAVHAMAESPERRLQITAERRTDRIEVTVRDTGPGIAPRDLPHLFDAFFTTREAGRGLGLGLSISARIIDEMGGRIQASNHPEGGAVFTVELPAAIGREDANA